MAERGLTSNLIIKATAPAPDIKNLDKVDTRLSSILSLMNQINSKKVNISVNLLGDTKALASLKDIIKVSSKAFKMTPQQQRILKPEKPVYTPSNIPAAPEGSRRLSTTTSRKTSEKGEFFKDITEDVQFVGRKEKLRTITKTDTSDEDKTKVTDLGVAGERRRRSKQVNRPEDLQQKFREAQEDVAIREQRRKAFEQEAGEQGFQKRGFTKFKDVRPVKGLDATIQTRAVEYYKTLADGSEKVLRFDEARDDNARESINKNTKAFKDQQAAQRKAQSESEIFARKERTAASRRADVQAEINQLQSQGYQIASQTPYSVKPIEGSNRLLTGTRTQLERRISSGNNQGALEQITLSDLKKRTGPTEAKINKDTDEYRANQEAIKEQRRNRNAAQRAQARSDEAVRAFDDTDRRFQRLTRNLTNLGYVAEDVSTKTKKIAPGIERDVVRRRFVRANADGTNSVIEGQTDKGGRLRRTDRNTEAVRAQLTANRAVAEFDRTDRAFNQFTQRMTALGFRFEDVGQDLKEIAPGIVRNVTKREFRRANADGSDTVRVAQNDRINRRGFRDEGTETFRNNRIQAQIAANAPRMAALQAGGYNIKQQRGDIILLSRTLSDGSEAIARFNRRNGDVQGYVNENTRAFNEYQRAIKLTNQQLAFNARGTQLEGQGYTRSKRVTTNQTLHGQNIRTDNDEFRRVSGNALFGNLQVEIEKMDASTGKMNRTVLQGADAMRVLGDSFSNATAKVALWLGATQGIFIFINAVQRAFQETKELEKGTILLARVSRGLGNEWDEQLANAKLLTNEIINLSTMTGVSAIEAQKAAAIFGRTGQSRIEIIESVRAALLASRIAELDVVEAASLLSAAQVQFNLTAKDMIPTLNSLNTLSNNYKVTTNDLLQSISRAGSVYAEHNGTLEQLAATTAVVAQVTNRTGAEIGNALKTIQSRLTAPEVAGSLLEKAGISTRMFSGETKNLTKLLLQLNIVQKQMNATERDRLNVTLAGARQVNILQSALNQVSQIISAEAKALRDDTSATKEFNAESKSLDSALARMSQLFTAIVSSGSEFGGLITNLVNVVNQVLRLVNAFDGFAIQAGLLIGVFALVRLAVLKFNLTAVASGAASYVAANGFNIMGVAATVAGRAVSALGSLMTMTNLVAAGLTVVLWLLTSSLSANEEATASAATKEKDHADQLERSANASAKKVRAAKTVTDALEEYLQALEAIEKQEAAGQKVDPETKKFYAKQIEIISGQAGLGKDGKGINPLGANGKIDPNAVKQVREQGKKATKEANEKLSEDLSKQVKDEKQRQENATADIEAIKKKEFQRRSNKNGNYLKDQQGNLVNVRGTETTDADLNRIESEILAAREKDGGDEGKNAAWYDARLKRIKEEKELRKSSLNERLTKQNDILDSEQKELSLKEKIKAVDADKLKAGGTITEESLLKAKEDALTGSSLIERFKKFDNLGSALSTGKPGEDRDLLKEKTEKLAAAEKLLFDSTQKLQQQQGSELFRQTADDLIYATEQMEKLRIEQSKLRIGNATSQVGDRLKDRFNLQEEFVVSENKNKLLRAGATNIDEDRLRINAKQDQARKVMDENKAIQADPTISKEEKIGAAIAAQKQAADLLNEAKNLEIESAKKLLNLETDILEEKQKQTKEAMKALGLLSDEDKIKTLAIANELKKNPNQKISAERQFMADEGTNKILQQFFGNNLDRMSNAQKGGILDFGGLRLGQMDEGLMDKEDMLKERLRGGNNRGNVTATKERISRLQDNADVLNGKDRLNPALDNRVKGANDAQQNVRDLTKVELNLDMMPLVDAFNTATTITVAKMRDELVTEINKIWDRVNAIPGVKLRGRDGREPQVDPG